MNDPTAFNGKSRSCDRRADVSEPAARAFLIRCHPADSQPPALPARASPAKAYLTLLAFILKWKCRRALGSIALGYEMYFVPADSRAKADTMIERRVEKRLKEIRDAMARDFPQFEDAYEHLVATLRARGAADGALKVGDAMPVFALPDTGGRLVTTDALIASAPLVLVFYRGDWCPYCGTFLDLLVLAAPEIHAAGGRIVCITGEVGGLTATAKMHHDAPFEILCDADLGVALAFGLVFPISPDLYTLLLEDGTDFAIVYGNESGFLPITATYIIDRTGTIVAADTDPDFRRRTDPVDIIKALEALRDQSSDAARVSEADASR